MYLVGAAPGPPSAQLAPQSDRIGRAGNREKQVVAVVHLRDDHVAGQDAGAQLQKVQITRSAVVENDVLPVPQVELVGIVSATPFEVVITGPAGQGVVAIATVEAVVTRTAREGIGI